MTAQSALLTEYVASGSEEAFREILARYIDLVYSTALRLVNGDTHRAEDVTQMVFADLARLSGSLSQNVLLGGWLHRRTFHIALTILRNERRRLNRERQACEMDALQNDPDNSFEQIAPYLDEAINTLNTRDRTAILLRFFEHRELRAVGEALGRNEDAAQKIVSRAVEKLRSIFMRRGVVVSGALIASILAANATHAAPASLAGTIASSSMASAASAGPSGFISTFTKTMLMKKTSIIAGVSLAAAVIIAVVGSVELTQAAATRQSLEKQIQQGLVMHLTFDRDESGTTSDSSGKGNHGKVSGARWTANGKKGGAYEFTADGDQIVVTNDESLNPEQLTLAAWIKTKTGDHFWRRIFDKSYSTGYALSVAGDLKQDRLNGRVSTTYGRVSMEIGPGSHYALSKARVDDGQWHHVAATFDGTNELIYVDGQLQATLHWRSPGQAGATEFDLVIGCNRSNLDKKEDDLGVSFRGLIDEPMVWNRALSAEEIAFLYQSQN